MKISKATEAMLKAGLKQSTIITLVHAHSGVGKRDVELVLNTLEALQEIYCTKPVVNPDPKR